MGRKITVFGMEGARRDRLQLVSTSRFWLLSDACLIHCGTQSQLTEYAVAFLDSLSANGFPMGMAYGLDWLVTFVYNGDLAFAGCRWIRNCLFPFSFGVCFMVWLFAQMGNRSLALLHGGSRGTGCKLTSRKLGEEKSSLFIKHSEGSISGVLLVSIS